jgi:hypothetical protein
MPWTVGAGGRSPAEEAAARSHREPPGEIRSILQRREKMQEIIDKMVAEKGAAVVFVR